MVTTTAGWHTVTDLTYATLYTKLSIMATFETFGDAGNIDPQRRMECKVCLYVYDPADGDSENQIPAGTPSDLLPAHWLCPNCGSNRHAFAPLGKAEP